MGTFLRLVPCSQVLDAKALIMCLPLRSGAKRNCGSPMYAYSAPPMPTRSRPNHQPTLTKPEVMTSPASAPEKTLMTLLLVFVRMNCHHQCLGSPCPLYWKSNWCTCCAVLVKIGKLLKRRPRLGKPL